MVWRGNVLSYACAHLLQPACVEEITTDVDMADAIVAECTGCDLATLLTTPAASVLVIDVRAGSRYAQGHVRDAVSLSVPKLQQRRMAANPTAVGLDDIVVVDREALARRRVPGTEVVLCDDANPVTDTLTQTIAIILRAEGLSPKYLAGESRIGPA